MAAYLSDHLMVGHELSVDDWQQDCLDCHGSGWMDTRQQAQVTAVLYYYAQAVV